MSMVDTEYDKYPPIEKDAFWEDALAEPLYTPEAALRPFNPQVGSCANIPASLDDTVMIRCRRTSLIQKHLDIDDAEVVPVSGLEWKRGSHASGESMAFSHSFLSQSRKLSEIVRRMRSGRRNTTASTSMYERRPPASAREVFRTDLRTAEEAPPSPDEDSIDRFGESFHNKSMPNMKSNGAVHHVEKDEESDRDEVKFSTGDLPVIEEEAGKRSSTDSEPTFMKPLGRRRRSSSESSAKRKRAFSD